jgi:hypothetical protein
METRCMVAWMWNTMAIRCLIMCLAHVCLTVVSWCLWLHILEANRTFFLCTSMGAELVKQSQLSQTWSSPKPGATKPRVSCLGLGDVHFCSFTFFLMAIPLLKMWQCFYSLSASQFSLILTTYLLDLQCRPQQTWSKACNQQPQHKESLILGLQFPQVSSRIIWSSS